MTEQKTATPPTVHQAILGVMSELKEVGKDAKQTGQGYNYRSINAVLAACQPLMVKHQLTAHVTDVQISTKPYNDYTKYPGNLLTEVVATWQIAGPAGDHITVKAPGHGVDKGDKATGKAMTYALKTMLGQLFLIPTEADNEASDPPPEPDNVIPKEDRDQLMAQANQLKEQLGKESTEWQTIVTKLKAMDVLTEQNRPVSLINKDTAKAMRTLLEQAKPKQGPTNE